MYVLWPLTVSLWVVGSLSINWSRWPVIVVTMTPPPPSSFDLFLYCVWASHMTHLNSLLILVLQLHVDDGRLCNHMREILAMCQWVTGKEYRYYYNGNLLRVCFLYTQMLCLCVCSDSVDLVAEKKHRRKSRSSWFDFGWMTFRWFNCDHTLHVPIADGPLQVLPTPLR